MFLNWKGWCGVAFGSMPAAHVLCTAVTYCQSDFRETGLFLISSEYAGFKSEVYSPLLFLRKLLISGMLKMNLSIAAARASG